MKYIHTFFSKVKRSACLVLAELMLKYPPTANWTLWDKLLLNFNKNTPSLLEDNVLGNVFCKISAILLRPWCGKQSHCFQKYPIDSSWPSVSIWTHRSEKYISSLVLRGALLELMKVHFDMFRCLRYSPRLVHHLKCTEIQLSTLMKFQISVTSFETNPSKLIYHWAGQLEIRSKWTTKHPTLYNLLSLLNGEGCVFISVVLSVCFSICLSVHPSV